MRFVRNINVVLLGDHVVDMRRALLLTDLFLQLCSLFIKLQNAFFLDLNFLSFLVKFL